MRPRSLVAWSAGVVQANVIEGPRRGLRRRAVLGARKVLVAAGDPLVRLELAGMPLVLPLSHDLPTLRAQFPLYSDNLRRLTAAVVVKYADLAVVDIGANVGDSVAFVRAEAPAAPVLCVEGDGRYLEILRANTGGLAGVSIAPVFLAAETGALSASLEAARGTGHLAMIVDDSESASLVPTMSLDDLLARYPLQGRVKLLKSDTDGFEAVILTAAGASLERHRPVLFIEYDPDMLVRTGTEGLELLRFLHEVGYSAALLYDNLGDLLLAVDLDERRHLEEMDAYVRGRRSERYLDVAAFHHDDLDLFETFRSSELDFFRQARRPDRS